MAGLTIRLLGAPRIERDGAPIDVDTRKAIALLAYLAVTGEPHHRDTLAALFWPEADGIRARSALRRTLSVLVRALDGKWLAASRDQIELRHDQAVWIDVVEFRRLAAAGQTTVQTAMWSPVRSHASLTQAVQLYHDDFMAGFSLRDSPAFDDWQRFQADELRRELAGVLQCLIADDTEVGNLADAIACARRWLALDPLNEDAHRRLMLLYATAGDRSAALQQYRACVDVLDRELGVTPLDETTALYQEIRQRRQFASDPQHPSNAPAPPRSTRHYPIVGRDAQMRQIAEADRRASAQAQLVAIMGEAGIGKTRLIDAALQQLTANGARQLTMRCYEGEAQMALRPVADMLRSAVAQPGQTTRIADLPDYILSDASRLLPRLIELQPGLRAPDSVDGPIAQTRFFDALVEIVRTLLASDAPGVLVIEDAHWIDNATLDFACYCIRRLIDQPLLVLVSVRSETQADEHRLQPMLAKLGRSCQITAIPLGRLPLSDVEQLAAAVTGANDGGLSAIAQRLYRETQGLPFFLIEYLNELTGRPDIDTDDGWPLPGGVRDLLRSRLAGLRPVEAQLLSTLATVGRACTFELLAAASGRTADEAAEALESLLGYGLAVELGSEGTDEPRYDVGHAKLREVVHDDMSLVRRRLLHRRIAEALGARVNRDARRMLAAQIAYHYQHAGLDALAAEAYVEAGDTARLVFANTEAVAHYQAALALGAAQPAALHEQIADVLMLLGDYERALAAYDAAQRIVEPERLASLQRKIGRVYHRIGEWELAEQHFAAARGPAAGNGSCVDARLLADWSLTAHRRGDPARSRQLALQALERATTSEDEHAMAQIHNLLGILARASGDLASARSELEASLRLAARHDDTGVRIAALNNLALVEHAAGDDQRAILLINEALAICIKVGDRHREAALHSNLADALHASGRHDEAMEHLRRSASVYAEIGVVAGEPQPEIWKLIEWAS